MVNRFIGKYYLYEATRSIGFITPIFALFVLRDLSFAQYGILGGLYSAIVVFGELPTGYVGDRYGHRTSLALSAVFTVLSLAGFVFVQSFWPYVLFWVFWGLAMPFASGSLDAWLYEALDRCSDFETDAFVRIRGRGESVKQWTSLTAMLLGGLLYVIDPTYPFIASVILNSLSLPVLFTLPAGRKRTDGSPGRSDPPDGGEERITIREALSFIRQRFTAPPLRTFVAYTGLFFAVLSAATSYIQPLARDLLEVSIESITVGGQSLTLSVVLGVLYAGFTVISAIASYFASDIKETLGLWRTLILVPVVCALLLVLPLFVAASVLLMFVALRGSNALLLPIVNGYLNDHVGSAGRATTLSAFSMCYQLLRIPLVLTVGVVADVVSVTAATGLLGVAFLFGAVVLWGIGHPARTSTPS